MSLHHHLRKAYKSHAELVYIYYQVMPATMYQRQLGQWQKTQPNFTSDRSKTCCRTHWDWLLAAGHVAVHQVVCGTGRVSLRGPHSPKLHPLCSQRPLAWASPQVVLVNVIVLLPSLPPVLDLQPRQYECRLRICRHVWQPNSVCLCYTSGVCVHS